MLILEFHTTLSNTLTRIDAELRDEDTHELIDERVLYLSEYKDGVVLSRSDGTIANVVWNNEFNNDDR